MTTRPGQPPDFQMTPPRKRSFAFLRYLLDEFVEDVMPVGIILVAGCAIVAAVFGFGMWFIHSPLHAAVVLLGCLFAWWVLFRWFSYDEYVRRRYEETPHE